MKKIHLVLFMLCLLSGSASATSIGLGYETAVEVPISGPFAVTGSATYALNSTTGTVRSSTIDTGALAGVFVSLTGTTGQVYVEYSGTNAAPWFTHYFIKTAWAGYVPKRARYMRFYADPATLTYTTASLMYWPATGLAIGSGGSSSVSIVAFTASRYVWAASTAFQATTAGMFVNASSVAGASCNDCKMYWQANALGYWDMGASASIPSTLGATTGFTISANVTPLLENSFLDGEGIYVKGQTGTVQFTVTVKKRQQ
jgi:hypothetical protein